MPCAQTLAMERVPKRKVDCEMKKNCIKKKKKNCTYLVKKDLMGPKNPQKPEGNTVVNSFE